MSYDKSQAAREFGRWSNNYDRSILQWLLFGRAHRAIIARIRAGFGGQALTILSHKERYTARRTPSSRMAVAIAARSSEALTPAM
jgi:hypothetical protein